MHNDNAITLRSAFTGCPSYIQSLVQETNWRVGQYVIKNTNVPFMHGKTILKHASFHDVVRFLMKNPNKQLSAKQMLHQPIVIPIRFKQQTLLQRFHVARVSCVGWTVPAHFDCSYNIVAIIKGKRTFLLSPPSETVPTSLKYQVHLSEGDCLIIPPGWWHQVINPGHDISILLNGEFAHPVSSNSIPSAIMDRLDELYGHYWKHRSIELENGFEEDWDESLNQYDHACKYEPTVFLLSYGGKN